MYSEQAMERFKDPKNAGTINNADAKGEVGNAQCGDVMKMFFKIENDVIVDAKFKTFGCVAAIISTDAACDLVKRKTLDQALAVTNKDVLALVGDVPPQKVHCSIMASEVIEATIKDYRKRNSKK